MRVFVHPIYAWKQIQLVICDSSWYAMAWQAALTWKILLLFIHGSSIFFAAQLFISVVIALRNCRAGLWTTSPDYAVKQHSQATSFLQCTQLWKALWHWDFQLSFALLRVLLELTDGVQFFFELCERFRRNIRRSLKRVRFCISEFQDSWYWLSALSHVLIGVARISWKSIWSLCSTLLQVVTIACSRTTIGFCRNSTGFVRDCWYDLLAKRSSCLHGFYGIISTDSPNCILMGYSLWWLHYSQWIFSRWWLCLCAFGGQETVVLFAGKYSWCCAAHSHVVLLYLTGILTGKGCESAVLNHFAI